MITTGINTLSDNEPAKIFPCFTIHPTISFKSRGFHYTSETYDENTFKIEDIFSPEGIRELFNMFSCEVKTNRTVHYGKVFSICCQIKTSPLSGIMLRLKKQNWDTEIFFFSEENDLGFAFSGIHSDSAVVNTGNQANQIAAKVSLSEIRTTSINTESKPCRDYLTKGSYRFNL
jgi:hypothetical protein